MQAYSNPKRESDPHSLPDVEVFYQDGNNIFDSGFTGQCEACGEDKPLADGFGSEQSLCIGCAREQFGKGWYWWTCLPGCMPDSDPNGPFDSAKEALADAQSEAADDDDDDDEA